MPNVLNAISIESIMNAETMQVQQAGAQTSTEKPVDEPGSEGEPGEDISMAVCTAAQLLNYCIDPAW